MHSKNMNTNWRKSNPVRLNYDSGAVLSKAALFIAQVILNRLGSFGNYRFRWQRIFGAKFLQKRGFFW